MRLFDLHCDTITELEKHGRVLAENDDDVSVEKSKCLDEYVQTFAIFIPDEYRGNTAVDYFNRVHKFYKEQIKINGISEYSEQLTSRFKSLLAVEGGAAMGGTIEGLHHLASCGVKLITITWNGRNELASGCFDEDDIGLTSFGKQAIAEMEKLKIAADVSHLSKKGFYDLADIATKPFIASHSCCDIVDNFKARHRNLTDDQIKIIGESGGIIGINLWKKLLGNEDNSFEAVMRHMSRMIDIAGEDTVAMGSDFDGCDISDDLCGVDKMPNLYAYLNQHGFDEKLLDKIFFANAERFFNKLLFTK